jgi:hypothetical protein
MNQFMTTTPKQLAAALQPSQADTPKEQQTTADLKDNGSFQSYETTPEKTDSGKEAGKPEQETAPAQQAKPAPAPAKQQPVSEPTQAAPAYFTIPQDVGKK